MTVIPFPSARQAPQREPLSFTLGARLDLRLGVPAQGVVRPLGEEAQCFSGLARLVRAARGAWRSQSAAGQIALVLPDNVHALFDADTLDAAAIEAGCTRKSLTFEFAEPCLIAHGPALAETLRARGWGVALRGDPDCPLPFGSKARGLYTELVLEAPVTDDPFFATDYRDRSPLGRRLLAAKEAGMVITAEAVATQAQARFLAMAGFDRGSGPFAERR